MPIYTNKKLAFIPVQFRTTEVLKLWFVVGCMMLSILVRGQQNSNLKLWYRQPAGDTWENALPIGNGKLGAMIYGNVANETIQLNEHTLWSGGPNRNDNIAAIDSLSYIRQLIWNGQQKAAEDLANRIIISKKSQGQMFQPAGEIHLAFTNHGNYTHYYRELDIQNAVAKTVYKVNGITYEREIIASLKDNVIMMHLTASKPNSISFTASYSTPQPQVRVKTVNSTQIEFSGTGINHEGVEGKIKYKGVADIRTVSGVLSSTDSTLTIDKATAVTIYISIATNFNSYQELTADETARVSKPLLATVNKTFQEEKIAHTLAYQKYFNRVKLNLGGKNLNDLPTDERLKRFHTLNDPQFAALYFQFGRYLLISSSQPGGQPANLQGIWNKQLKPAWDSKYTININAEMNYWPAEKTNLSEMHQPLLKMISELAEAGKETAKNMYGARGWMAHHNTDIWRSTGAVDGAFWGLWNQGGGWLSQHLFEHYLYSGDKKFLESIYPVLRGAALFCLDFLVEHPVKHWMVVNPDESPENAPKAHQGSSIDAGTTMTNQIVFDVLSSTIRSAEILDTDKLFIDTLKNLRSHLAPMHIGQYGQLQEWLDDIDDPNDKHRHVSHLYGLFPSNQISPYRTPALFNAARTTLMNRGDVSTGWSMGWKVNWWARMQDGNHAYKLIQNQLTPLGVNADGGGTYNNLFDAHPPFQIDGNFGCTSGIAEMLVQSAYGAIQLLPALPDAWQSKGSVSGLRAIGGFEIVKLDWSSSKITQVIIKSQIGGNMRVRSPNRLVINNKNLKNAVSENSNPFYELPEVASPIVSLKAAETSTKLKNTFVYDIATQKGATYILTLKTD